MPTDEESETETGGYRYPIDETMLVSMQARAAALRAADLNLTVGHRNLDFSQQLQIDAFHHELGPDAVRPPDDGVHHLFWIKTDAGEEYPINIPQQYVRWFLTGVAATDAISSVQEFVGAPGVLPLHDLYGPASDDDEGDRD